MKQRSLFGSTGLVLLVLNWVMLGFFPLLAEADVAENLYGVTPFLQGIELGAGGRALALGGAYRGLSDDLSGLYWNPAGLASVRRIEFSLGLSQSFFRDEAAITQPALANTLSRTRLNEAGLVFPVPTYRGSLVFAAGYQQAHYFDAFGTFITSYGNTAFQADELETGRMGLLSLGGAIDLSPLVSAGLAARFWSGFDDYSYRDESTWATNNWYRFDQTINSDFSGFNVLAGLLLRLYPWMRLGVTIESPLKLSIDRSYSDHIDSSVAGQPGEDAFSTSHQYHVKRSFRAGIGAAFLVKRLGISADVVANDWSQLTYPDALPLSPDVLTREEANLEAPRTLRTTAELHAGLEYWLPWVNGRLQAGYAYLPSPFDDHTILDNRHLVSGGFSFLVDPSLQLQGTLVGSTWDRHLGGWHEKIRLNHFIFTLSYRL